MSEEKLTNQKVLTDFKDAYEFKRKLIERQREDFLFAFGQQWTDEDKRKNTEKGVYCVTDNRIRPNIYLLTGIERQNRSDFRAFPEGEEDGIKAQIATSLYKNIMKQSEGEFKFSEQFEDGVTCGESYLELYLDSTYNLLNPKPNWKKTNFDQIFPEPGWKEYDFSDAAYLNKWTRSIKKGDLISLFPEKKKKIEAVSMSVIGDDFLMSTEGTHVQPKDYGPKSDSVSGDKKMGKFDLLERYYKKWMDKVFVLDVISGEMIEPKEQEGDDRTPIEIAKAFVNTVNKEDPKQVGRFRIIERFVPEIWVYSMTPGLDEPLVDERAWFYPKWKGYGIIPFFGHWSSVPLKDDEQHLNIQGIVHGVKDAQIVHNRSKTLELRHLNSTANSGWLEEEGSWVDPKKVEQFGSVPGINLQYRKGHPVPQRITPSPLSAGHEVISQTALEAIKGGLGINADLLGQQQGSGDSGRLVALRQRQGVVVVQKLFDNLARTKKLAGKFILSQLSEIYDKETVKKVLGPAFIQQNFSRPVMDPQTGQPMVDQTGQPTGETEIAEEALNFTITQVLEDMDLGKYDVEVGEAVASETMKLANFAELQTFASTFPGIITPEIIIEESQLPSSTKNRILSGIKQQKAGQMLNSPVISAATANGNMNGAEKLLPGGR